MVKVILTLEELEQLKVNDFYHIYFLELGTLDLYCALIALPDVYKRIPKSNLGISMVKYATWRFFLFFWKIFM
jgi:hypothetical protein